MPQSIDDDMMIFITVQKCTNLMTQRSLVFCAVQTQFCVVQQTKVFAFVFMTARAFIVAILHSTTSQPTIQRELCLQLAKLQ